MKRRDFICGASCMLLGFCIFKHNASIWGYKNKNEQYKKLHPEFNNIKIVLTPHCNLNCKNCFSFSPLAKENNLTYEQFKSDFTKLKSLFPKNNPVIDFFGGEPLLNPDLMKIVELTNSLYPDSFKTLSTNGILLNDMSDDFYKLIKKTNVTVDITEYPINIDRISYEKKLGKYDIPYRKFYVESDKIYDFPKRDYKKVNNVGKHKEKSDWGWRKLCLDLSGNQDFVYKRYNCEIRDKFYTYTNGNLYLCNFHAFFNIINEYFKLNIKIGEKDYLKISDIKDAGEVIDFLASPNKLCSYCNNSIPTEWGFSKREISEWT